tara:strand:- start:1528 stop:2454 length:927 start_codon:yes stop_codon:yes gene_type:complete
MDAKSIEKLVNDAFEKKILNIINFKNEYFNAHILQVLDNHGLTPTILNNNLKSEQNKQKLNDLQQKLNDLQGEIIIKDNKFNKKYIQLDLKIEKLFQSNTKMQKYNVESKIKFQKEIDNFNLIKKSIFNFGGTVQQFKENITEFESRINSFDLKIDEILKSQSKKIENVSKIKKPKPSGDKYIRIIEKLKKEMEVLNQKIDMLDKKNSKLEESNEILRKDSAKIHITLQENYEVAYTTNKLFSTQIYDLETNHKTIKQEQDKLNDLMTKINKQVVLNTTTIRTSLEDIISFQTEKILYHNYNSQISYE